MVIEIGSQTIRNEDSNSMGVEWIYQNRNYFRYRGPREMRLAGNERLRENRPYLSVVNASEDEGKTV